METLYLGIAVAIVVIVTSFFLFKSPAAVKAAEAAAPAAASAKEPDKPKEREAPCGPLTIYFGSQTGTAEGFSEVLKTEAAAAGFTAKVVDLDDFDEEEFKSSKLAICVLATYGEGEPTDNAATFYKWLKEGAKEGSGELSGLAFTVFGLGNRQYEHFSKVGNDADKWLEKMGGERVFEVGNGDDDGTLEEDFETWKDKLWPALSARFQPAGGPALPKAKSASAADLAVLASLAPPDLPFTLTLAPATRAAAAAALVAPGPAPATAHNSTKHFFTAARVKVVANRELRNVANDGGSTRHIEVDISDGSLSYETADNLAVLPENDPAAVEALAAAMGYDLDATFTVAGTSTSFKPTFPTPCSVREALSCFVDLHGLPRRTSLKDWAPFATDPAEAAALTAMAGKTAEGKERYKAEVEAAQRGLVEILTRDFKSIKVPLAHLLHGAPHLMPRYYTISSSASAHPRRIHATVAVLESPRPNGEPPLRGVCSTFLAGLVPPAADGPAPKRVGKDKTGLPRPPRPWPACRAFVRPSTFRLPADPAVPIVMVGPGTGIAPMRALLQERRHQRVEHGLSVGPAVLYFGCKHRDCDFLYADELNGFKEDGTLTALHLAISRPNMLPGAGDPTAPKVYVQHLMAREENAAELWSLLDGRGGHLYVCGGTAMGADVGRALLAAVEARVGAGGGEAYVAKLKAEGRYVQELWT